MCRYREQEQGSLFVCVNSRDGWIATCNNMQFDNPIGSNTRHASVGLAVPVGETIKGLSIPSRLESMSF